VQLQCTHSAVPFERRMSATAPGNILIGEIVPNRIPNPEMVTSVGIITNKKTLTKLIVRVVIKIK